MQISETWGAIIVGAFVTLAIGALVYLGVRSVQMHDSFHRYLRRSQPDLTVWQRYTRWTELSVRPDELRAETENKANIDLVKALRRRDQVIRFYQWVFVLGACVLAAIGLFKFLAFVYVKGQQVG